MRPARWMAVAALALLCAESSCTLATAQGVYVSDGVTQDFTTALSPHGDWVMTSGWGVAWRPWPSVVGPNFVPYVTGGRWVSTGYGWMFVTGWDWGWAPFHYGRWFYEPAWGWLWLPGNTWAPAWVEWRYGGGYAGWAPLGPAGWSVGFGGPAWCFVSAGALASPEPWRHRLHGAEAVRAHDATSVLPPAERAGRRFSTGPPAGEVAQQAGVPLPRATVRPPPPGRAAPAHVRLPQDVRLPAPLPRPSVREVPGAGPSSRGAPLPPPPSAPAPRPGPGVPPPSLPGAPARRPGLPPPSTPGPSTAIPPGAPAPTAPPGAGMTPPPQGAPGMGRPPAIPPGSVPPSRPGPPPGAHHRGR